MLSLKAVHFFPEMQDMWANPILQKRPRKQCSREAMYMKFQNWRKTNTFKSDPTIGAGDLADQHFLNCKIVWFFLVLGFYHHRVFLKSMLLGDRCHPRMRLALALKHLPSHPSVSVISPSNNWCHSLCYSAAFRPQRLPEKCTHGHQCLKRHGLFILKTEEERTCLNTVLVLKLSGSHWGITPG